jgi:type II secretion system protein G
MRRNMKRKIYGFTLIELLVVISIIAVIMALVMSNFLSARDRAKDAKIKLELTEMKNALRLYYNDYSQYPGPSAAFSSTIDGCGAAGTTACGTGASFTAGTSTYMKQLPDQTSYAWQYIQRSSGDDFWLRATLNNTGDQEIGKSQTKCNATGQPGIAASDYVVCAD